jgi:hypothetical protein
MDKMTTMEEIRLQETLDELMDIVMENNIMLHQICDVINFHHARHNRENEDDFIRNVLANLLSSGIDIRGFLERRNNK